MVNFYTTSVADEHDPRGPDGPYQFKDRSVPLFIIKKWDGETLIHQLGFARQGGDRQLAAWVEKAVKENGPISPPKALRPLMKAMDKARAHLAKERPGPAWKELVKVVEGGSEKKHFPDGPPTVAVEAQQKIDAILEAANDALEEALMDAEDDPATTEKALRGLLRTYSQIPDLKKTLNDHLKKLKG